MLAKTAKRRANSESKQEYFQMAIKKCACNEQKANTFSFCGNTLSESCKWAVNSISMVVLSGFINFSATFRERNLLQIISFLLYSMLMLTLIFKLQTNN